MTPQVKQRIEQIRRGEVPEGYKKTKVGIVPDEWKLYKLCEISEELHECASDATYETLSISAGMGFVNQANKFGKEISGAQYSKYTVLKKGDFSYNKGNSKKYPQGCIYQLKDRESAAVPNVFESFRLTKGNNDFFEQLFMHGFLNSQLFSKINHGVRDDGLLNLRGNDFYSSYVLFPPLPEQEKIVGILSAQDKVIELQAKKIEQLKLLKKGYLQRLFPKKGCNYPELRFKGFTDAWEHRKVTELGEIFIGLVTSMTEHYTYEGVLLIRNSDIKDGRFEFGDNPIYLEESFAQANSSRMHQLGDVITVHTGDVGTSAVISENQVNSIGFATIVTRPNTKIITSDYLCTYLNTDQHKKWAIGVSTGDGRTNYNLGDYYKCVVPVSIIEEQKKISEFISDLNNLITLYKRKLDEEKQKKKALMQLLLTGIVRVDI